MKNDTKASFRWYARATVKDEMALKSLMKKTGLQRSEAFRFAVRYANQNLNLSEKC